MLDENAVLDTQDIGRNPVHGQTHTAETAMYDHKIVLGDDQSRFVFQRRWNALYKVEQSVAPRLDMRAVLDVLRRPESFSRCVVAFVEQRVKRLEYKVFVLLLACFLRMILLLSLLRLVEVQVSNPNSIRPGNCLPTSGFCRSLLPWLPRAGGRPSARQAHRPANAACSPRCLPGAFHCR